MKRIWYDPAGVAITHIPGGTSRDLDSEGAKLLAAGRSYAAAPHEDFEDDDIKAFIPSDRVLRGKWRKNPVGRGVFEDLTVPDPPNPVQATLDKIVAATSLNDLKRLLVQIVDPK